MFPQTRLRRLRSHPRLRDLVRETRLSPADLVLPLFVRHGEGQRVPIGSMPGQSQLTVDLLADEVREIVGLGIPAVILFGIPEHKDGVGSDAYSDDGIVQQAVRAIKAEAGRELLAGRHDKASEPKFVIELSRRNVTKRIDRLGQ